MKQLYTAIFISIILIQDLKAQNNNLVIYSQEGLKFTVILNGAQQNNQPETNVKITKLNAPNYQVKLVFQNNSPDVNQNVYLTNGAETTRNKEYTYSIKNIKGKYKLRFISTAPVSVISGNTTNLQTIIVYNPTGSNSTSTTTTTSNTIGINTNTTNGVSINTNTTSTSSYSTTTTTTSGNGTTNHPPNTYILQGYNGVYGCPYPMNSSDFENAKQSVKSKGFDESRLTIAKQIVGSNCLLCSQIKELMQLMSFEATKLDLAKFAWHHNLDKGNYFKLNDAFGFESSISELNQYTQSH